ncbi:MAG: hypothetical protein AB1744_09560 [Candidatus Zixiibacteriota bacterium]
MLLEINPIRVAAELVSAVEGTALGSGVAAICDRGSPQAKNEPIKKGFVTARETRWCG